MATNDSREPWGGARPAGSITLGWGPVADGTAIPGPTWANGAPAQSADIPMIIGTNLNELSPSLSNAALEAIDEARARTSALAAGASAKAWAAFRAADPKATQNGKAKKPTEPTKVTEDQ